nr:hypothetical protein CFP56_24439 [Quercus suber]
MTWERKGEGEGEESSGTALGGGYIITRERQDVGRGRANGSSSPEAADRGSGQRNDYCGPSLYEQSAAWPEEFLEDVFRGASEENKKAISSIRYRDTMLIGDNLCEQAWPHGSRSAGSGDRRGWRPREGPDGDRTVTPRHCPPASAHGDMDADRGGIFELGTARAQCRTAHTEPSPRFHKPKFSRTAITIEFPFQDESEPVMKRPGGRGSGHRGARLLLRRSSWETKPSGLSTTLFDSRRQVVVQAFCCRDNGLLGISKVKGCFLVCVHRPTRPEMRRPRTRGELMSQGPRTPSSTSSPEQATRVDDRAHVWNPITFEIQTRKGA